MLPVGAGICAATILDGPMVQQSGLKMSMDLVLRVQVVYVLGLFLVGKHRKKVQRKLAELQLVPGLSELFDQFIWKCQVCVVPFYYMEIGFFFISINNNI